LLEYMSAETSTLWQRVQEVALSEGVELFDLDVPGDPRRGGVLRVFITKPLPAAVPVAVQVATATEEATEGPEGARTGISFEDCVRVSKRLLDIDEQQELIPEHCTLEVSSPGINRTLRLPQHFIGAVGERVRVKFCGEVGARPQVVHGYIRHADEMEISLEGEVEKESVQIPLRDIKEARVDFKF